MRRLLCGIALFITVAASAQNRDAAIDSIIATLSRVQSFGDVTISPDGSRVAYVKRGGDNGRFSAVEIVPSGGGLPVRISAAVQKTGAKSAGNGSESSPDWSPDGREIAFISNAAGDASQICVASADGSAARAVTNVKGELARPRWSPDGTKVAFLFIENASRRGGATEAMTPPSGDVEKQVQEQRIAIVEVASKKLDFATPANMYVYDFDWSPDSKSVVAEATFGSGENNYWIAQLFRFDLGNTKGRSIYKPSLQICWPRWSPDGKHIAFIEGLMSDEGSNGGDVMIVPAEGGGAVNLTKGMPASAATLSWAPDSRSLLIAANRNGESALMRVTTGGKAEQLWSGAERISTSRTISISSSRNGSMTAAIRESFSEPAEIWAGPIGAWKRLTRANASVAPLWGHAESINWKNDAFNVQGWLLLPKDFDKSKKHPMVVQVHGGPSAGVTSSWPSLNTAALLASGYVVFEPNPRGSFGQGEAFTRANVKDFGYGDFRDILAGVDAVTAKGFVDDKRIGIWGWSYGGYMTMWSVTQTKRFRAAVAGAGIANWQSYYGENSIDQWMIPFFGASVYDDPKIYERSSPITFIKNVKTPTLILVGERDGEVPAPQSFEFWHALKTLGVKTQLIVYPGEGHGIRKPEHRRDIARRMVLWFDENM